MALLALVGLAASGLFLRPEAQAATNANIVILSYDNTRRTIPTALPTVGALLNNLGIKLNQGDVVEPALSARIDQDEFRINIYRARPVEIVDGTHKIYTFSAAASPRAVAQAAGVTVYPEDDLTRGPVENFAEDDAIGDQIVIDRATPVNLMLYGHQAVVRTHATTVGDLVKQKDIVLQPGDTLTPAATTPIASGLTVTVAHQGITYTTVTQAIPMPVNYVPDASLSIGTSAIRQQGSDGQEEVTYQITTKNGVEVSRTAIQTVVISQPVEQIVARGTAMVPISGNYIDWMNEAGISASDQPYANYIISHESGWNPASLNSGGCAGLGQACPGSKLANACPDWQVDPVCQLEYFSGYAAGKGGWYKAYLFKQANGWW